MVHGGFISSYKCITSGILQCSHHGPLLFTIYINDITKITIVSKLLMYANATKIFKIICNNSNCDK